MRATVLTELKKIKIQLNTKEITEKESVKELRKRHKGFIALINELSKRTDDVTETMKGGETVITFIFRNANIHFHADGDCIGNIEKFARNIISYRTITFN